MNTPSLPVTPFVPAIPYPPETQWIVEVARRADAELLALVLGDRLDDENILALSEQLLARHNGLAGLTQAKLEDLTVAENFSCGSLTRLLALVELWQRISETRHEERPLIKNAADAAWHMRDMAVLTQENVRVLLLDSAHRVIASPTVYIGTMHLAVLRTAEIFREAIIHSSAGIIIAHNHPSGDPLPSPEDVEMTHALAAAGSLLEIALVDHIIIGRRDWVSLREQGYLR